MLNRTFNEEEDKNRNETQIYIFEKLEDKIYEYILQLYDNFYQI